MITQPPNRWVETQSEGITWSVFHSSKERRLVFFRGGSAVIKPIGDHTVPFFGETVEAIGLINMTPLPVEAAVKADVVDCDGVHLSLTLSLILAVRDEETSIAHVALHPAEMEARAVSAAANACQAVCSRKPWRSMLSELAALARSAQEAMQGSADIAGLPFHVHSVSIVSLGPSDTIIAKNAATQVQQIQASELERLLTEVKKRETTFELELQKLRHDAELTFRKELSDQGHKELSDRAALFERPGAIWAAHPELAAKLDEQRIRIEAEHVNQMRQLYQKIQELSIAIGTERGEAGLAKRILEKRLFGPQSETRVHIEGGQIPGVLPTTPPPTDGDDQPVTES